MALQGVADPTERRRHSVTKGRQALEELKLGVLGGKLDNTLLLRLKSAAAGLKDSSGDRNVDAVIAEIDLPVEVELAKLGSEPTLKHPPVDNLRNGVTPVLSLFWYPYIRPSRDAATAGSRVKCETWMSLTKDKSYRPSVKEPFMNERQKAYFRQKLLDWRDDILKETKETLQHLQDENQNHPDIADRASSETDRAIELRARDRQRKLIAKIDAAIGRIDDGSYGYCEETGEPISLKRLEARPIATLSIEAQERHERRERVYRDE